MARLQRTEYTTIRYRLWDAVSKKIYVTYRLVVAAAVCSMTYHVMPLTPVLCWLHSWILRPCYTTSSSSSSRLSAVQRQASSSCRVVQCTRQAAAAVDRSLNNLPSDNSALHFAAQLRNRTNLKVYCGYCHLYFILFYFCTLVYLARTACNQQRTEKCISLGLILSNGSVNWRRRNQTIIADVTLVTMLCATWFFLPPAAFLSPFVSEIVTRSPSVARIADRTASQQTLTFRENYLCACSAFPIQSRLPNLKSLAQVVFEICSIECQKLQGSRDLGHAHFQGKLFVRPLGIPDTKLHTKFEASTSSSSLRDIAL